MHHHLQQQQQQQQQQQRLLSPLHQPKIKSESQEASESASELQQAQDNLLYNEIISPGSSPPPNKRHKINSAADWQ
jgi:hypothetical protein